jgi:hypothetical protein
MTVSQLLEALAKMPPEAVVLMESDCGLSLVSALELLEPQGNTPTEVLLLPSMAE